MMLIINADDYAMSDAVSDGIIIACQKGIVTSTTVLCNQPQHLVYAAERIIDAPKLGLGCHLNLTTGRPLTECPSVVDETGNFVRPEILKTAKVDEEEVYSELKAQVEMFIKTFQRKPTHLDGHYHITLMENMHNVMMQLGSDYKLRIRGLCDVENDFSFMWENATPEHLKNRILAAAASGKTTEIMCHPGLCDRVIYNMTRYAVQRVDELRVLISTEIISLIEEHGIQLVSYADLSPWELFENLV